ncbi:MAG: DUF3568 family protein [Pseudomonadota bacterium]
MKRVLLLALLTLLTACDPVSLTALGIGGGAGVSHTMGGYNYRTFNESLPKVKKATLTALKNMDIKVESVQKTEEGEIINAKAADRNIELTLEKISSKTTRMRSIARRETLLMDAATATEIIVQTEKALGA